MVDSTLIFVDPKDDIRGRKVLDQNFKEIGTIISLYVNDAKGKVYFLRVASGGILGIGETTFLVPVETITKVTDDEVHINVKKSRVTEVPAYDPELVEEKYLEELYGFYGFMPLGHFVGSR